MIRKAYRICAAWLLDGMLLVQLDSGCSEESPWIGPNIPLCDPEAIGVRFELLNVRGPCFKSTPPGHTSCCCQRMTVTSRPWIPVVRGKSGVVQPHSCDRYQPNVRNERRMTSLRSLFVRVANPFPPSWQGRGDVALSEVLDLGAGKLVAISKASDEPSMQDIQSCGEEYR